MRFPAEGRQHQLDQEEVQTVHKTIEAGRTAVQHREVTIPAEDVALPGNLSLPEMPSGAVIFAHGSGSSRLSPRNVEVASVLNHAGFATLRFDLLTEGEAFKRANVFNVTLLADRLAAATRWVRAQPEARPLARVGASSGRCRVRTRRRPRRRRRRTGTCRQRRPRS
jgi:putative phosphoribosyl transferase